MPDERVLHDVLRRFAHTMANQYDITEVLHELCDSVSSVLGTSGAGVVLLDDHGRLRLATASSHEARLAEQLQEQFQTGPCVAAIERGRPVRIEDVSRCDEWPAHRDAMQQIGWSAIMAVPMVLHGRKVGALDVYDTRPRPWTDAQSEAAEVLADVAAAYVLNASELLRTQRTAEQLQLALESRVVIEQAKGRLAGELGMSPEEAFSVLRRHARSNNLKLRDVAEDVVRHGATTVAVS